MGRKKKRAAPSEADRIFCYYCERKFQTEQILLAHQKEKHLRCPTCSKRLFSISGLVIHSSQVHNVQVTSVPNAIEGRTSTAVDVVGMKGIPASYYHQQPAKAARTDPSAQTAPTPVYDAPPPSAPAYPQYPPYAQGAPPELLSAVRRDAVRCADRVCKWVWEWLWKQLCKRISAALSWAISVVSAAVPASRSTLRSCVPE